MESIGTMAGGIAHDFNNLLTVINGYSHMLLQEISPDTPYYDKLEQILMAGRSAGNLTSQLLAFSRKQPHSPEVADLSSLIANMDTMLRSLIGEDINININLKDVSPVLVDRAQFEQVLVNLVVNARDAIYAVQSHGFNGNIIIETGEVILDSVFTERHPGSSEGRHVFLAVSDNGIGIEEKHISRIFEPFFTTKESHKGTGLGLATVYGIVKQNQAYISVNSSSGQGAKFIVYWPSAAERQTNSRKVQYDKGKQRGSETVLLVEDSESVSLFAEEALLSLGYEVYTAGNGQKALDLIKNKNLKCDLIVTDLVMPEMGGKDFIESAMPLLPEAGVIFMSGYTDGQIVQNEMLEKGINFLQKPFTIQELSLLVRKVLDGPGSEPV
ncbi:hybrid sensor histidine kinase/response regulator [Candidatus Fermentibacteria bacterium]|nr:MAG: hybrid sensor histidine kinase/response regulator [Candidatus Fermentibacteria bacterium]